MSGSGLFEDIEKVINGRRFDTSTAILIGRVQKGRVGPLGMMDFTSFEEALYKTPRSGRYFLAGRGGAITKYGRIDPDDNGRIPGEGLFEVSHEEAYAWAEENQEFVDLERWFGDQIKEA